MCERFIAGFLLATSGLLVHTVTYADIFRCVGVDGSTLYTNIACSPGRRGTTIVTSDQACRTADCESHRDRDYQEATERARAEKEQLTIDAEEGRGREDDAR